MKKMALGLGSSVAWLILTTPAGAGQGVGSSTDRALIIVGLPGDAPHQSLFARTAWAWKKWLVGPLGFPTSGIRVLSGTSESNGSGEAPGTRESIARAVAELREKTPAIGRLWVLVLGHANLDDGHAFLHLPGPDLRDDEFAALFQGLAAKEQVFWLTTPASGAFVRPLATPGRIVVAATEPSGEVNETEFPHALADLVAGPAAKLDLDRDGRVSILEIYMATVAGVEARFRQDHRAPTEHARLDDDGDGVGTEPQTDPKPARVDGALASKTYLPSPTSRSQNGQDRIIPPPR